MSIDTKHKVPALRFPGFRDEWEERKLGSMGTFIGGGTPDTSVPEYWNGDIQWFTPTEIKKKYVSKSNRTITEKGLKNSSAKLLPEGTVLISTRATVGDVGIAETRCATNQGFQSLLVNDSEINTFWYYWIVQHKNELVRRSSGSTFLEIGKSEISKIIALRPDKEEQQKIAAFLTSVDTKIEQLAEKKSLLEQYKKGMMQKLFSQARRFKDEDGNDFPDWEESPFLEILNPVSTRQYQINNSDFMENGLYPVVDQGKNLIAGYSDNKAKVMSTDGVIVYGDHTTIVKYVDFDFIVGADGTKVLKSKGPKIKYLYYCVCFFNIVAEGYKRHFSILKKISLPVPSEEEQQKIADFLSAIDRKMTLTDTQLAGAKAFKKGLLQRMFA